MKKNIQELCKALINLETEIETYNFLKDLCTPQELRALAERWNVCQLLDQGDLSYRDIHQHTQASLTTIGRVARFLKEEPNKGYVNMLKKLKLKEKL